MHKARYATFTAWTKTGCSSSPATGSPHSTTSCPPEFPTKGGCSPSSPSSGSSFCAMSSGRLFLDRVARQHCPSPLHRHTQINMHSAEAQGKGDISILPGRGHFYFALTKLSRPLHNRLFRDSLAQSKSVGARCLHAKGGTTDRFDGRGVCHGVRPNWWANHR